MKTFLVLLIAVSASIFWSSLVAPVAARTIGIPMAIGLWRTDRKNRHLTRSQYVWAYGVFGFGIGMFLLVTLGQYLAWRLLGESVWHMSLLRLTWNLTFTLCLGFLLGVMTVGARKDAHPND